MTDHDQFERELLATFLRPWPTRRGFEPSDSGHDSITVRAAPADVTAALVRRGARAEIDAIGKKVTVGRAFAVVVRLKGHAWSMLLGEHLEARFPTMAAELSKELPAPVLKLVSWEESLEYSYFEVGDRMEHLIGNGDSVSAFASRLRSRSDLGTLTPEEIADRFAKEHDVYINDFTPGYFFGDGYTAPFFIAGERLRVSNPGIVLALGGSREVISTPEIEKLDYLLVVP